MKLFPQDYWKWLTFDPHNLKIWARVLCYDTSKEVLAWRLGGHQWENAWESIQNISSNFKKIKQFLKIESKSLKIYFFVIIILLRFVVSRQYVEIKRRRREVVGGKEEKTAGLADGGVKNDTCSISTKISAHMYTYKFNHHHFSLFSLPNYRDNNKKLEEEKNDKIKYFGGSRM